MYCSDDSSDMLPHSIHTAFSAFCTSTGICLALLQNGRYAPKCHTWQTNIPCDIDMSLPIVNPLPHVLPLSLYTVLHIHLH